MDRRAASQSMEGAPSLGAAAALPHATDETMAVIRPPGEEACQRWLSGFITNLRSEVTRGHDRRRVGCWRVRHDAASRFRGSNPVLVEPERLAAAYGLVLHRGLLSSVRQSSPTPITWSDCSRRTASGATRPNATHVSVRLAVLAPRRTTADTKDADTTGCRLPPGHMSTPLENWTRRQLVGAPVSMMVPGSVECCSCWPPNTIGTDGRPAWTWVRCSLSGRGYAGGCSSFERQSWASKSRNPAQPW